MLGCLHQFALRGVRGGQNERTVQRQGERGCEEQGNRDHVGRVVMKVQELIAHVRDPVEVAQDAIGETVTPGTEQQRTNDHQGHVGKDGNAKGHGHVIANAQLSTDFNLTQCP